MFPKVVIYIQFSCFRLKELLIKLYTSCNLFIHFNLLSGGIVPYMALYINLYYSHFVLSLKASKVNFLNVFFSSFCFNGK